MLSTMFDLPVASKSVRPLSRIEYDRMVALGMFDSERIELLRGLLVKMSPIGWLHNRVTAWLTEQMILQLDRTYEVRTQGSFAASDWSEPEPDVAIARKDYGIRDLPSELLLVIEVAESSLVRDRTTKLSIYAEATVPEYWIVDLVSSTVEVYTQPSGSSYARLETLRDGDTLRPVLLPSVLIAVSELPR